MVKEQGTVVLVGDNGVWVETLRKSACSGCKARKGCGQHLADKYAAKSSKGYVKAASDWSFSEGDRVIIGIPEGALLRSSIIVYLLPLAFLMVSVGMSAFFQLNDAFTAFSCIAGLLAGFITLRLISKKESDLCDVRVIGLAPATLDPLEVKLANSS